MKNSVEIDTLYWHSVHGVIVMKKYVADNTIAPPPQPSSLIGLTASLLLIPLTPYKVAVINREASIRGNMGCRELAARFSSPCPQEQEPAHRKASDRLPSFKLAERCCLKNQWGSNGRNVPVDSSKNRGSFPNNESALKLLYLALRNISKKWTMPVRLCKQALNQFVILFPGRLLKE